MKTQSSFKDHLELSEEIVSGWPSWKRDLIGKSELKTKEIKKEKGSMDKKKLDLGELYELAEYSASFNDELGEYIFRLLNLNDSLHMMSEEFEKAFIKELRENYEAIKKDFVIVERSEMQERRWKEVVRR